MDNFLQRSRERFTIVPMELPEQSFFTRRDLAKLGVHDADIRRAKRAGFLVPLGWGAYAHAGLHGRLNLLQRHALAVRAVASAVKNPIVSHWSAAVLNGLDMWRPELGRVHLSIDSGSGGRVSTGIHLHTNRFGSGDVVVIDGIAVTSRARTAVDIARASKFESGVVTADSALASGATVGEMRTTLAGCTAMKGYGPALRVVEFADGKSASVGESRSRVYLQRLGFAAPELQVTLLDRHSNFIARPDFLYEEEGVILEFDGRIKYTSDQVRFDEKKRQELLESHGWVVDRWAWDDLSSNAAAEMLQRAFARAQVLPPPTTIRQHPRAE